jgi:hypothetical protein
MLNALIQLLGLASPVLERIIPDPNKRIELTSELQKLALENQASLNQSMAEVMKADATSEGFLTRNARPAVVVWSLVMVTWVGVLAPLLGVQKEAIDGLLKVPAELWNLISIGIGGYMLAKTVENSARAFAGRPGK